MLVGLMTGKEADKILYKLKSYMLTVFTNISMYYHCKCISVSFLG